MNSQSEPKNAGQLRNEATIEQPSEECTGRPEIPLFIDKDHGYEVAANWNNCEADEKAAVVS